MEVEEVEAAAAALEVVTEAAAAVARALVAEPEGLAALEMRAALSVQRVAISAFRGKGKGQSPFLLVWVRTQERQW